MSDRCDACGASFWKVPRAPMLTDNAWAELAEARETLCAGCMFERAVERRVALTWADLLPCEFNFWHSPSWYDLFHGAEGDPANIAEWRAAGLR
jgi:hypothetical protein